MKYVKLVFIFILGIAVGRFSAVDSASKKSPAEVPVINATATALESAPHLKMKEIPTAFENPSQELAASSPALQRTEEKAKDKYIRDLYSKLKEAEQKGNAEEQNRLFAEMESLNPRHEVVFRARAEFMEDDQNWEGALEVYKECVAAIPDSVACLKRLSNIRSSTIDDKIKYGTACLEVAKDDVFCIVDLAIALSARGEYVKAKEYFERALSLPVKMEGYKREYILYHYGFCLKGLSMGQEARNAFIVSCKLKMKAACDQVL